MSAESANPYASPLSSGAGDRPISQVSPGTTIEQADFSVRDLLDQPLADVLIEGNATILSDAILREVHSRAGRIVSERTIQEDVTSLYNTRWFLSVRPLFRQSEEGPVLVFQVVERPILKSVTFKGNKKIKTQELQQNTGLVAGHGYDVSANRESVARIKQIYMERGYRFAEVTLEKGNSPDDREVIFVIDEGPKVRIGDIEFTGNTFDNDAILKTKIDSKTVKVWIIGGDYDPEIVRNDVIALKQYYMDMGFFDVDVHAEESFSEDRSRVRLHFVINEGKRYRVRDLHVLGNQVISDDLLLAEPKLKPGDQFNARFLRQDVNAMLDLYDKQGRIFANVVPTPQFAEGEDGWVDIMYRIDEDVPRYIGTINIHIRGDHPHSKEETVRNQVHRYLKPGQLARNEDLRMARSRVSGSGIWDRTNPAMFDIKPTDGHAYMPQVSARGQSLDREALKSTSAELEGWVDDLVENIEKNGVTSRPASTPDEVFGHTFPGSPVIPVSVPDATNVVTPAVHGTPAPLPAPPRRELRNQSDKPGVSTLPSTIPTAPVKESVPGVPMSGPVRVLPPEAVFCTPAEDIIVRAQSPAPAYRSQSLDAWGNPIPQDYLQGVSPQGDPFGDALTTPPPGFVDVNIAVSEGQTGRLMFGVGVNSDAGVIGSIILQEDNFDILRPPSSFADIVNGQAWRGAGQSFRLEAVPGSEVSRYMVTWQDPFFMRTDYSLGVNGFYYNRFYRNWTEDRLGGRLSLGYVIDRYWSVSGALRLENVDMRSIPAGAPPDLTSVRGDNFLSTVSGTVQYDTRDNVFMPTRGHFADLTYEQGFGEFTYPRVDISAGQYFTTYERPDGFGKHIFSLTGQVGWTGDDTPIFERYYAGGYSSFRGFAFRGVTPVQNGIEVGGDFLLLGSAEYMVPLTADDNIRAVVFTDFGTVEPEIGLDAFRVSAGFGFRLSLPMMGPAPLAFDFAWPILKEDFDRERIFSFYVGFVR